ncbi:BPTD_3080 family restriction endonuclease [Rhodospirillum rubrum]|uniref:Type III restriction enzyme, res subunit n=1 Tax=Rhodospirillum rubrum (strain ATCC 11170 / ATH 1.1.1 / DSM 467 / LMG 4362 / NCIMB 8255 / S1) TaxID=269796 RepID=Q2RXU8_RHORT|nr:DEAD/DEAH box helicase family protein [Rhodospirillum rubrum]ABC21047.1 Type III restriction enzyme, res subunit [Rhodospirillum rubrum ATCC 11170]AEO46715.1 Type III restriction enzyme, res subunit [Rhodospirillum rubrum F11]MBK5952591.1 restriction endonuclease [Rhodospirillum rubrum]QXG80743.1 DEAD/DEAH box helicase family protein [Rhodospirillum rubrum]HAQ00851.1 restriction endonuclease [Rhodospirillum rubrum]
MSEAFFDRPILNSPYEYPSQHWELDAEGQPTNKIIGSRRRSDLITPVPKPKKRKKPKTPKEQSGFVFDSGDGLSTAEQEYNPTPIINEIRQHVGSWRSLPNPSDWLVTPETARLLQHWRHHTFHGVRPFFCQVEAVETAIWLTEVAPKLGKKGERFWDHIKGANEQANPELLRLALKLATGAGKTTVMAMLIAWQTVNAVRHPNSKTFSRGFLLVAPGITIRDRLRVLLPNDPESYYRNRELVPADMLADTERAKIVITNYHAFKLRERLEISKVGRALLRGRGPELNTLETEGQMIQRVMPDLMGLKNIVVLNDEAHHCYREKPQNDDLDDLKGEDKEEAKKNNEAARMWISGLEMVKRTLGLRAIFDLSATPFFLRGSGYAEGTLFPWTVSDFSLMDAIECGIVKLPRVPVAQNAPGDTLVFRNLWDHIGKKMPKAGRSGGKFLDPLSLPAELQTALYALYGHYEKTYDLWQQERVEVPPVFIVVCNNTSTSKLVYDFISGFYRPGGQEGASFLENGRLALFRNYDDHGNHLPTPRTLLIDSEQLESGDALDKEFRASAADEIERFRRDIRQRTGDIKRAENITDQDLLREVMNTVGKKGKLGEQVRCVVSVSMLTEGWDTNTVTHVLGVRAFGTQLLCEQVIGRALRRQNYELNEETGLFNVEYADVLGVPFDFNAKPVVAPPVKPRETVRVQAVRPDRDALEITFPRVEGYRVELPDERLVATFTQDSVLDLTPDLVGPSITTNQGIIGQDVDLTIGHLNNMRQSTILFHLTKHLLYSKFRDPGDEPKLHLFGELKRITRQWLDDGYLRCSGGTFPAQLVYQGIADMAAERIKAAITLSLVGYHPVKAILDAYNPTGTTATVNFTTSKPLRWKTDAGRCPINWIVCDSDWEAEFCRVAERHPLVRAYVKNHGLGFEVPYLFGSIPRRYLPDFIVQVNDGRTDPLNLIVEIKGFRGEDAKDKANTMHAYWVPGVNNLGKFGRWAFAEFTAVYEIEAKFNELIASVVADQAA